MAAAATNNEIAPTTAPKQARPAPDVIENAEKLQLLEVLLHAPVVSNLAGLVNVLGDKNLEIEFHVVGMNQTGQEIKCK